jgi:glycosyltransferase involved in cell wall biosynthesis
VGFQRVDTGWMDQGLNPVLLGKSPEVTVLMSCYNASRWLHEAIGSVLCQTFENFEFILIDDGSTDDTWDVIRMYRDKDPRIVPIKKENTGLQDSLNVGIAHARGAWIARLDADDLCEPDRLAEQLRYVNNHPEIVLLGAGFVEIDEQGLFIKKHLYPSGHRELVCHLERMQRFFPHSSAFYRVDEVRKVGGYNSRIRRAEDWNLWLKLASIGKMDCLRKPLVKIRKHSNQISLDDNGKLQLRDGIASTVCHYLQRAGCEDPSVGASTDEWIAFLALVENRIDESGTFERRKAWADARAEYFQGNNRMIGAFHFGTRLLKSGHAVALMWEKVFGSSLPECLAREWMKRSCAAS